MLNSAKFHLFIDSKSPKNIWQLFNKSFGQDQVEFFKK